MMVASQRPKTLDQIIKIIGRIPHGPAKTVPEIGMTFYDGDVVFTGIDINPTSVGAQSERMYRIQRAMELVDVRNDNDLDFILKVKNSPDHAFLRKVIQDRGNRV